jgi:hypothetical protein
MNATTTTTATDQRPTCCECGSHNVETMAWTDYTADGVAHIVDGDPPHSDKFGNWCHECQEHVYLDFPTTKPADDARRQAANAARNNGPELLAALAALVRVATVNCGPLGNDADTLARARELVDRLA